MCLLQFKGLYGLCIGREYYQSLDLFVQVGLLTTDSSVAVDRLICIVHKILTIYNGVIS